MYLMQESKDVLLQRTQEERRQREVCAMNQFLLYHLPLTLSADRRNLNLTFCLYLFHSCKAVHEIKTVFVS